MNSKVYMCKLSGELVIVTKLKEQDKYLLISSEMLGNGWIKESLVDKVMWFIGNL